MDPESRNLANFLAAALIRANGYAARREIGQILKSYAGDAKRLEAFGFKVYSQNDEDGILQEIFRRVGISKGVFCEIGVENGLECNSLFLLHKGWTGSWIEANPQQLPFINEKFRGIIGKRLNVISDVATAENINDLLARVNGEVDFLSIDIDGNDVYLFDRLSTAPKVICIEYNSKFPGDLSKQQKYDPRRSWAGTDYVGSSLKAIAEVGEKKGYRLVGTNISGVNAFFVRNDLAGDLFTQNSSSEYLYNPPRYWLTFDHFRNIGHPADFGPYVDLE